MIQIPQNLMMPLAGALAVVAVGTGVYIGRATAQPPAICSPQSVSAPEEAPSQPEEPIQPRTTSQPEEISQPGEASAPFGVEPYRSEDPYTSAGDIGAEAAKAIALAHEDLSEDQVNGLWAEWDWEHDRLQYEVKFWKDSVEYEFEIDGATGTILKHERETHENSGPSSGDIGEAVAKAVALAHVGLSEDQVTGMWIERDWEHGRFEYEVDFWQEAVEYEITIDGATGMVLKFEREDHTVIQNR